MVVLLAGTVRKSVTLTHRIMPNEASKARKSSDSLETYSFDCEPSCHQNSYFLYDKVVSIHVTRDTKLTESQTRCSRHITSHIVERPISSTYRARMLSILRKARLKDKEMRILMLGLDNAGKTTIVKKIMGEDVNSVSPTLGFIIKTIDYEGYDFLTILYMLTTDEEQDINSIYVCNSSRLMHFWPTHTTSGDVGGQKTLRSYWRNYFEKTDALIWVVDATDRLRIEDCKEELHGLLQEEVGCLMFSSHANMLILDRDSPEQVY